MIKYHFHFLFPVGRTNKLITRILSSPELKMSVRSSLTEGKWKGKHSVSLLLEIGRKVGCRPTFNIHSDEGSKAQQFSCAAQLIDVKFEAKGFTQKGAKKKAAGKLIDYLTDTIEGRRGFFTSMDSPIASKGNVFSETAYYSAHQEGRLLADSAEMRKSFTGHPSSDRVDDTSLSTKTVKGSTSTKNQPKTKRRRIAERYYLSNIMSETSSESSEDSFETTEGDFRVSSYTYLPNIMSEMSFESSEDSFETTEGDFRVPSYIYLPNVMSETSSESSEDSFETTEGDFRVSSHTYNPIFQEV